MTATYIPTIHMDSDNHAATVEAVRKACLESGFFYVTGHGIDTTDVIEQMKYFFDLPIHEKSAVSDSTLTRGYTAMCEETLDPNKQTIGDTKEGFYINILDIPKDDPRYNPSKLLGPNQWPTIQNCPSMKDHNQFKITMTKYMEQVMTLSLSISRLIAESLGLSSNYFDTSLTHEPMATLRLLHYDSTTPSNIHNGIYACGEHSDYGMITILLTIDDDDNDDNNGGLQIFDQRGCQEWISVPSIPNSFIVNLGDMLQQWTNQKYCSTIHRVINNTFGHERYSIPFFSGPSYDTIVKCLDVCCSDENPPKYPPTTSGEYLLSKYRQTHADFTPVTK